MALYKKSIENVDKKDLVFIDESGIEKRITQEYFWTQKGKIKNIKVSGKRSSRTNVIAALTDKGIEAQFTFEGACNTELFVLYIETVLCPILRKGQVVIMDNASFHKSEKIKILIEKAQARLVYLSPYSPDLNPIEHYWAVLKNHLKMVLKTTKSFAEAVEKSILATISFGSAY